MDPLDPCADFYLSSDVVIVKVAYYPTAPLPHTHNANVFVIIAMYSDVST